MHLCSKAILLIFVTFILMRFQRVMPDYFLVLLRFYMRVDGVVIRVNDTRLFYEVLVYLFSALTLLVGWSHEEYVACRKS